MTYAFISYSRKDKQFVQKLHEALSQEKNIWVDWEDIPPTAEWRQEIGEGIEAAENVIFVISPDFVASSECDKELEHAIKNNKRLVPIVCREVEANSVRLELSKLNWIFFRETDDFDSSLQSLRKALETDLAYVKEHTRLLTRAIEWNHKKRDLSRLLRGRSLKEAQQWLVQSRDKDPKPTQLHNDYIINSIEQRTKVGQRRTWVATVLAVGFALLGLYAQWEREIAEIAEIKALTDFSEASRLKDEQLEALKASILAAKKWQDLKTPMTAIKSIIVPPQTTQELETNITRALRNAVYNIEERNHLEKDTAQVYRVNFSPNSQLIASVTSDNTINLWNRKGKHLKTLKGHKDEVYSLSFSPHNNSQLIASASKDKTVKLWKEDKNGNWNLETTLHHSVPVRAVAFLTSQADPETVIVIASVGIDGLVRLWNLKGKLQTVFKAYESRINDAHESRINYLSFSPECQMIATASKDGAVKIWSWDGKQITLSDNKDNNRQAHEDTVWEVDFSPNCQRIATASSDTTVKLWNLQGKLLNTLLGHTNWVKTVAFSPKEGKLIVSGSEDDTLRIWRSDDGSLLQTFRGHRAGVNSISFSSDGQFIASTSGKIIRLWKLGGTVTTIFHGPSSAVKSVSFQHQNQPDGQLITSVSGQEIILWKISNKENEQKHWVMPEKIVSYKSALRKVDFTHDGRDLVTSSYDGTLQLWNNIMDVLKSPEYVLTSQTKKPQKDFQANNSIVNNFSISRSQNDEMQMLASAHADGSVKLWDLNKGELIKDFKKAHESEVKDVSFSPDAKLIVSVSAEGLVKIWNIDGTLFQSLPQEHQEKHLAQINAVAFHEDGKLIATASNDRTIIVWKRNEKTRQFKYFQHLNGAKGHQDSVWDVTFSPKGKKIKDYKMVIASAGRDNTVKLWGLKEGLKEKNSNGKFKFITTLRGHKDWVRDVSFNHDGKLLVSASADKTIILWDLETILNIETETRKKKLVLNSLLDRGCQWLSEYLNTYQDKDLGSACQQYLHSNWSLD